MSGSRGDIFLLSAPSGAGKTTLIRAMMTGALAQFGGVAFSVSHTTRRPRAGEVDGRDYHFVDAATFQRMIAEDRFLEWAEVHGHYYGTSVDAVLPSIERGVDMILDLDVQGAERLMARFPEAHSIFILPPSYEDLEQRLRGRALDDPAEIARSLAVSLWEIRRFDRYHYVIVNAEAERAAQALASIILEKRFRRARMESEVRSILAAFQSAQAARSQP
jgi:guanylate kinase